MKNNKDKKIEIRISEEEKEIIMNYCKLNNINLSKLIREFINKEVIEGNKYEQHIN